MDGKESLTYHICVFDYEPYVHVQNENKLKLDNNSVKYIFSGYGIGVKGYTLWDPMSRKVLYSKDVIFREVNPSPIVVQQKEEEKKLVFQLQLEIEKVEPKNK